MNKIGQERVWSLPPNVSTNVGRMRYSTVQSPSMSVLTNVGATERDVVMSKRGFGHSPECLNECWGDWERYCTVWSLSPNVSTNVAKTERDVVMSKRGFGQSPECLNECCGEWERNCTVRQGVSLPPNLCQRMFAAHESAIAMPKRGFGHSPCISQRIYERPAVHSCRISRSPLVLLVLGNNV